MNRGEKTLLYVGIFLGVLILGSIAANITGNVVYSRAASLPSKSFSLNSGSIADYYYRYSEVFDFFIFLLMFLGISQMIFSKHFGELNKMFLVGTGTFLALALVLWENRTGSNLLELSGPLPIVILLLVVLLVIWKMIKSFDTIGIGGIAWTYIIAYIVFFIMFDVYQAPFIDALRYYLPIDLFTTASVLFVIAFVLGIGSLLRPKKTGGS